MASNQGGNKGSKQAGNSANQGSKGGASQQSGNAGNQGNNKGGGNNQSDTSNRGFASMDPEKQRAIAAEGGRAAHASGNAHEFTPEEARAAGKLSHGGGNRQSAGNNAGKSGGNQSGGNQSGGNAGGRGSSGGGSR